MRKVNSVKNFISNVIPYFILTILGFVKVSVFIKQLGIDIYAINQLFFQIFSYLSLLESGIGVLITQRYYKYLVKANHFRINRIYTYSVKYLRKISLLIIIIGIVLSFGLKLMTNNNLPLSYMQIVFILFLIKNVIDYLMFSPRFVLQADQKIYKVNLKINLCKIVESSGEIGLLSIGYSYITILVVGIIIRIIFNYLINRKIFKEYPWLHIVPNDEIERVHGMRSVFIHKITGAVHNNTDIIIISAILAPIKVVIYSAYNTIIRFIADFVFMMANAITASYGNVIYKENKKDRYIIFEEINSLFLFLAMFFSITVYMLSNSFITIWIGSDKIMDNMSLIFMILIMFYTIARKPLIIMRDAMDLFNETKNISIMESIINLILSFILIFYYGLAGVLFATVISMLVTTYWFYPQYIYNKIYKITAVRYYVKYFLCMLISIVITFVSVQLFNTYDINNYYDWLLCSAVYSISIFTILMIINYTLFAYFRRFINKVLLMLKDIIYNHNK